MMKTDEEWIIEARKLLSEPITRPLLYIASAALIRHELFKMMSRLGTFPDEWRELFESMRVALDLVDSDFRKLNVYNMDLKNDSINVLAGLHTDLTYDIITRWVHRGYRIGLELEDEGILIQLSIPLPVDKEDDNKG